MANITRRARSLVEMENIIQPGAFWVGTGDIIFRGRFLAATEDIILPEHFWDLMENIIRKVLSLVCTDYTLNPKERQN